jgi:ADP-heptose:LPS heptosyltransferase
VALSAARAPRAVVLRALGLGDLLTGVPALRALRRGLPGHELVLLAPCSYAPLVAHADLAHRVVDLHGKDRFPRALPPLGEAPVDVAVDLHGRGPASQLLLSRLAPARLVAFDCPPVHRGAARWVDDEHEVTRWCRLLTAEGFPADPTQLSVPPLYRPVAERVSGAVVLHPGAASPARRWPAERWAALAERLHADGWPTAISAGPGERELAAAVSAGGAAPVIEAAGVLDLVAIVSAARAVVVGDTGVAHLAVALGTPSVSLFGPTSPSRWGPPRRPEHEVLWAGTTGDPHGRSPDAGLLAITVSDVAAALSRLPGPRAGGEHRVLEAR